MRVTYKYDAIEDHMEVVRMDCVLLYIVHGQVYYSYYRSITECECNNVQRSSHKGACLLASVRQAVVHRSILVYIV